MIYDLPTTTWAEQDLRAKFAAEEDAERMSEQMPTCDGYGEKITSGHIHERSVQCGGQMEALILCDDCAWDYAHDDYVTYYKDWRG